MGCVKPGGSCVVDVLATRVDTTYEYADLESEIASMSQDILVSFTDTDIESMEAEPPAAARIKWHMTPEASARIGTTLDHWSNPFRLSCNGTSLFVGVIYNVNGQAALKTPVMHVSRDTDNSLVLRVGAWQCAWLLPMMSYLEDPVARQRLDRPELRAVFCQRGVLKELASDSITGP